MLLLSIIQWFRGAIESVGFQQVARMREAKYGDDRRHHCFPVFRFAHTGYLAARGRRVLSFSRFTTCG
ncbi:hypothetical protein CBUD_0978a [Coxiella burnetii Dugway 5J108-111]|uniref:Uncharacterized protein n=1 Tax=Coxiella burnetii (strain Dugway 5J108-111) TaxID=434922 RepID=B5XHB5_COXBN|nr:hypothetical protein CBUD_0978a [Coxiella burnetii Dugway 5J108-111]